nr:MAG TPA: hypothetical protein [Caudoviricetes sp.]DAU74231.1 MAG TPA: hypothetical protein [Caudoviricetes sp.]
MVILCQAIILMIIEGQTTIPLDVRFVYRSRGKAKFLAG